MISLRVTTSPGLLGEQREQLELRGREVHGAVVDDDLVAAEVDAQAAHDAHRLAARGLELAAAQDRAHAAHQLGHRERLRDVVVGAELESEHAVGLAAERGQDDDRHRSADARSRRRTSVPQTRRQAEVEDHDVERLLRGLERLGAVADLGRPRSRRWRSA